METGDYALLMANGASLDDVLNMYAHALAEKIRRNAREEWTRGSQTHKAVCLAAKLIDPIEPGYIVRARKA